VSHHEIETAEPHYMLMFSSQGESLLPQVSHVFAAFVKTTAGGEMNDRPVEAQCISWLPETLKVEPLHVTPEAGRNLSLAETIQWAKDMNARITMWGPFRIDQELYDMAIEQVERLNAKSVDYVMLDVFRAGRRATNCIHAVCDLDTTQKTLGTGILYGEPASERILRHFERYIIPSSEPMDWLVDRLGVRDGDIRQAEFKTVNVLEVY